MKQFNLQEYLANPSRQVVTRDGRKVRIVCTDKSGLYTQPIVALITLPSGEEIVKCFWEDGTEVNGNESRNDLFFAPEKHEGWINIKKTALGYYCSSHIFQTKEDAENHEIGGNCLVVTKKVEWEE